MKNVILALGLVAGLSACATCTDCDREEYPAPAPAPAVATPTPVAAPVVRNQAPASYAYTVSEPVEVIYKNTTYRTVYEPKTYSTTDYVKKPYSCNQGSLCNQSVQPQPEVQQ